MAVTTAPRRNAATGDGRRPGSVWASLARAEARRVARHPLVLVGLIASGWLLWSMNRDQLPQLTGYSTYVGLGLAPLAGAATLVGHLIASRARRHDTVEIESITPALERARTAGRLLGALVVIPIAAVMVAAYMAFLFLIGGAGQPDLGELLVGPLVVGIGAVVGTAAGTWFPNRFTGLAAVGALAAVQIVFQDAEGTRHWLAWWHTVLWYDGPDLWIRPSWVHLAYLAGIAAVIIGITMLRWGLRPVPLLLVGVGIAAAVAGGIVQVRPPSEAQIDAVFDQIANAPNHWVSVDSPGVTYRIYPGYERWSEWWDGTVQSVLAPVPAGTRPNLVIEQWHSGYPSQLIDEFGYFTAEGEAIHDRGQHLQAENDLYSRQDRDPWPIWVGFYVYRRDSLAIAAAQRAVGFPLEPVEMEGREWTDEEIAGFGKGPTSVSVEEDGTETVIESDQGAWWPGQEAGEAAPVKGDRIRIQVPCDAGGQAREVVAAWLAARADSELADIYRRIRADGPGAEGVFDFADAVTLDSGGEGPPVAAINWSALGWTQFGSSTGDGVRPVFGSPAATDLAAQLLERLDAEITVAVTDHWVEWTDPATPVQVIIDAFDLEPPPTAEQWLERAGLDSVEYAASIDAYPPLTGNSEQPNPVCR